MSRKDEIEEKKVNCKDLICSKCKNVMSVESAQIIEIYQCLKCSGGTIYKCDKCGKDIRRKNE